MGIGYGIGSVSGTFEGGCSAVFDTGVGSEVGVGSGIGMTYGA